jgi:signal transduction histidine kinase
MATDENASTEKDSYINIKVDEEVSIADIRPCPGIITSSMSVQPHQNLEVDALICRNAPIRDFLNRRSICEIDMFGSQRARGTVVCQSEKTALLEVHSKKRPEIFNQLGYRLPIEVRMHEFPLVDLYSNDIDAGRLLIWKKGQAGTPQGLIAVGRISRFFNCELDRLVAQLMALDQIRSPKRGERTLVTTRYAGLYHSAKRNTQILMPRLSEGRISIEQAIATVSETTRHLEDGINEIISLVGHLRELPEYKNYLGFLGALTRHLTDAVRDLLSPYEELLRTLRRNGEHQHEVVQACHRMIAHYTARKELIERSTTQPITKAINESMRYCCQPLPFVLDYRVHSNTDINTEYYPKLPELETLLRKDPSMNDSYEDFPHFLRQIIGEIVSNSVKHSGRHDDTRIDVFIDPPQPLDPSRVVIWFQDNGILTDEVLDRIDSSVSGCAEIQQEMQKRGAEFEINSEAREFGTTFKLSFPVWYSSLGDVSGNTWRLAALLSHVDRLVQEETGYCPGFLLRLLAILKARCDAESLTAKFALFWDSLISSINEMKDGFRHLEFLKTNFSLFVRQVHMQSEPAFQKTVLMLEKFDKQPISSLLQEIHQFFTDSFPELFHHSGANLLRVEGLVSNEIMGLANCKLTCPENYLLMKNALIGLLREIYLKKEYSIQLHITQNISENGDRAVISILGHDITEFKDQLLPLMTRLANLRIQSRLVRGNPDMLIVEVPVWKVLQTKQEV